jgi:hypothetical protein
MRLLRRNCHSFLAAQRIGRVAASASAGRVLASESVPIATEEIDQSLIQTKRRRNPRLFGCKLK